MDDKCKTLSKTVTPINKKDDITADVKRDRFSEAGFSTTADGNRAICADCHLQPRPYKDENLSELHSTLRPNCKYVTDVITKTETDTDASVAAIAPMPVTFENSHHTRQDEEETDRDEACEPSVFDMLTQLSTMKEKYFCKICKINPACMLYFPCKDSYSCEACARVEEKCRECNKPIKRKVKIFPV